MQIEAIPMLINSDFMNVPLDKLLHLMDYKMHGEDSYVFQQKELLHGLYECTYLSINDKELSAEALDYLLKNNKNIGEALSNVYGIERKDILSTLSTMSAVVASSTAMSAVAASSMAMSVILNSPNCMFLQNTGLPGCRGDYCYGKFLLVGSINPNYCVDSCSPDYKSHVNAGYKLTVQSPKFGTVYTKIGVPNVPTNTIFTMLNDSGSGNYCIVYRL